MYHIRYSYELFLRRLLRLLSGPLWWHLVGLYGEISSKISQVLQPLCHYYSNTQQTHETLNHQGASQGHSQILFRQSIHSFSFNKQINEWITCNHDDRKIFKKERERQRERLEVESFSFHKDYRSIVTIKVKIYYFSALYLYNTEGKCFVLCHFRSKTKFIFFNFSFKWLKFV